MAMLKVSILLFQPFLWNKQVRVAQRDLGLLGFTNADLFYLSPTMPGTCRLYLRRLFFH